jgi:hypothetical protein
MCVETTAVVSGSEKGSGQPKNLERFAIAGDSPVGDGWAPPWRAFASTAGHGKPRGKLGRPRSKAKYVQRPIADEYREGTVKSTPARGVKQLLKPSVHSQREPYARPSGRGTGDRVPIEE